MTRRVNYNQIAPSNSFVGQYMEYMRVQESPAAYDFWSAMWLLSIALGRDVVVPRPRAQVFMNWYVLLVAESGVTRKSSVVRGATDIARQVISRLQRHVDLVESKSTPEKIEDMLRSATREHQYAHMAISISELVTFMGKEKYTMQLPGLMTDLYDCPSIRTGGGTIARGNTEIRDVFVSLISASTPTWLARSINPDVIEGGFTSRCIFVVSEKRKKRIAWPDIGSMRDGYGKSATTEEFVDRLLAINKYAEQIPEIVLTDSGMTKYENWYRTKTESRTPFLASFESREDSHVLRLAACLAVNDDSWMIDGYHMTNAIRIINEAKYDGSKIFVGNVRSDRLLIGIDKLRDKLIEGGLDGVQQSKLHLSTRNYITSKQMNEILSVMHELELVQRFDDVTGSAGRNATVWRATNKITARGMIEATYQQLQPE